MKRRRILQIVEDLDIGGTEKALCKWLNYFNRDRFDVNIISFRDGILRKEIEDMGIKLEIFSKNKAWDLSFLLRLVRKIKDVEPELIHCRNGIPAISYGVLAAKICRIPVISSIHGRTHYIKHSLRTKIWFWIMGLSDIVITVSNSIKEEIAHFGNIDKDRVKVIYNGIESNGVLKQFKREDFGLDKDDYIIGTVGNLRKIKGHRYLIEAMPLILKQIPNAKIVLIGDGTERFNLERLAKELNIKDKIKFLGYSKDAKELIGIFDIFVLPSLSEGFPNVLLEAMVNKKPIVSTKVGGVGEIVRDYYSALLVNKESSLEIAQKILEIKNNPVLTAKLITNAYQDLITNFSIERFVKEYEEVYMSIAGAGR